MYFINICSQYIHDIHTHEYTLVCNCPLVSVSITHIPTHIACLISYTLYTQIRYHYTDKWTKKCEAESFAHCDTEQTDCHTLQHAATHCKTRSSLATDTLQHTTSFWNTLQHTLQHTVTHCNTLQHTAIDCNVEQHTIESSSFLTLLCGFGTRAQSVCDVTKFNVFRDSFKCVPACNIYVCIFMYIYMYIPICI